MVYGDAAGDMGRWGKLTMTSTSCCAHGTASAAAGCLQLFVPQGWGGGGGGGVVLASCLHTRMSPELQISRPRGRRRARVLHSRSGSTCAAG